MPQTGGGRTGREKKRAVRKGLPVPVMSKKAGSPRPIAAGVKTARNLAAKKTVRRVTRAAVRKGISGPTEDSLGITRQEGGRAIRKAVKRLGTEKATKVAAKTRLRQGQTYEGGKGWVTATKRPSARKLKSKRG